VGETSLALRESAATGASPRSCPPPFPSFTWTRLYTPRGGGGGAGGGWVGVWGGGGVGGFCGGCAGTVRVPSGRSAHCFSVILDRGDDQPSGRSMSAARANRRQHLRRCLLAFPHSFRRDRTMERECGSRPVDRTRWRRRTSGTICGCQINQAGCVGHAHEAVPLHTRILRTSTVAGHACGTHMPIPLSQE